MTRFVALFHGINVGKAKRMTMADLRALLESLGYTQVQTLLNSGNAVFESAIESGEKHAHGIRDAVAKTLGVDALVIVKSAREIAAVVAGNKLAATATDPSRLLASCTKDAARLRTRCRGTRAVHGQSKLAVTQLWRFSHFWLLSLSKTQFITLPLADLSPDMQAYVLQRVRAAGGKIDG